MKGSDSQTPGSSSPGYETFVSAPRPTPRKTASASFRSRFELFAAADSRTEPKLDAELLQRARLVGKRVAHLAIGGDRIADEPAELLALVEDGHGDAPCGELSRTGEAGRAGADDDDPSAGSPSACPEG